MMTTPRMQMLLFRCGSQRCALPASDVSEVMRPQPINSVTTSAAFVDGMSLIRGLPVPVVSVARLLDCGAHEPASRFIIVKIDSRLVALAVSEVYAVREFQERQLSALPPLLGADTASAVTGLEVLDHQLLVVLGCARLLSSEHWDELLADASA